MVNPMEPAPDASTFFVILSSETCICSFESNPASMATAVGTAETAKIGFPQNIPMLIGYAAQAVGIISSIRSATSKAKASVSLPSSSNVASSVRSAAPTTTPQTPSFNIVGQGGTNQLAEAIGSQSQQPIKAYVVSNDVTTAQELDRNIVESASL